MHLKKKEGGEGEVRGQRMVAESPVITIDKMYAEEKNIVFYPLDFSFLFFFCFSSSQITILITFF